ncbi:hypothetical protein FHG87_024383 [Trinorchestia longiramus]|nr:hypothetical protein FHG87_024383 [Trinorchestia longiramus]
MGCQPENGLSTREWAVNPRMGCQPKSGLSTQEWTVNPRMDCQPKNGLSTQEWTVNPGMDCQPKSGLSRGTSFTLGAITVDPESAAYDPRPLIPYLAHLGVPYLFEQQGILQQALNLPDLNSICSFCSRMKRGRIYAAARSHHYNVLAFGQHLDDLAESFLMSAFHNGRLRTMKASYHVRFGLAAAGLGFGCSWAWVWLQLGLGLAAAGLGFGCSWAWVWLLLGLALAAAGLGFA